MIIKGNTDREFNLPASLFHGIPWEYTNTRQKINQNSTNPGYQCTKDINQYYLILIHIQSKSSLTDNYSLLTNN